MIPNRIQSIVWLYGYAHHKFKNNAAPPANPVPTRIPPDHLPSLIYSPAQQFIAIDRR